jgi:hypothetical protein
MRASEAIELIRRKRGPSALYNGSFVRYLRSLTPERARIVDLGETVGARFVVYYDASEEIGSQQSDTSCGIRVD